MNQNNQKDLENKGWEAMLQSLDREMPTQKKRRGLLWLWLPLSILALGGGVWWVKTKTIQSETIILSSKPVAEQADFSKKVPQTFGGFQKLSEHVVNEICHFTHFIRHKALLFRGYFTN